MKSLKIVLASMIVTVGLITLSSFASKSYNKNAFAVECWQYIGLNYPTEAEIRDFTSTSSATDNWVPLAQAQLGQNCPDVPFLCAICFETTQPLTVADAIDALADIVGNNFQSIVTLQGQEITVPGTSKKFNVYLKDEQ